MATTPNPAITLTPAQIAEQVKAMNVQAMNSAANTAMSPQANKGGSVAQMQQQAQTPAETIAKAQATPGVMQLGATTGATQGGQLPVTPTQFQAVTGAGATMDAASLKQMQETEARNEASRVAEANRLKQSSASGTTSYYDAASGTWKQGSSPETQKIQAEMAATTPTWDAGAGTWKTGTATVGTAGATGAGADMYANDPRMKLLAEQQKQIENRLNSQQQYIQQQFDAKIKQEAARQKSESGQSAMVLSRMGAMGTTASGVSYLQSLDTQHAAQISALENEKQSAIMQAQDASNAQLLDLAFKKVAQIDSIDEKYRAAATARLADVQKYQVIAGKSFDDLAASGKTLEDFPSGYFEHQDDVMRSYGADVPPGTSEAAFVAAKKAQEFKEADTEEKRKTAAIESAAKLITVLDKIPKGKTIKIGDSEYEGIGDGNIKTGTETDSDGNVTFYQYDAASGSVKTTSLGTIGKSQDGWETKFDDSGKPWRMNAKTGQLVPFSPSNEQINIQSQLPDGSVWTRNGVPAVECGAFVNDLTGAGVGDTKESKIAKCDPTIKPGSSNPPQVGDFFVQTNGFGWTGHIGVVAGVDTDTSTGKTVIRALESNYPKKGQITSSRPVDVSQIAGFGRTPANSDTLKQLVGGPDAPVFGSKKTTDTQPASVKEYEYARNQGFTGSFEDWQKKSAAVSKPATLDQSNAAGYAQRIKQASDVFDKLETSMPTAGLNGAAQRLLPDSVLINWMKSTEYQQQEQAEKNFINAQLRRESGAAISPQEFANARSQYFPQPGDAPEVLKQKKENRTLALQNMAKSAGPALSEGFAPVSEVSQGVKIKVRRKANGVEYMIDADKFNPNIFDKIQ